MKTEQEKKCFIITPIGSESDPIRRHIEGIIEAAIRPALGDKYELIVAHKIYEPGSITKQVISEIYNAELVIANLTNRNPNVMYELAFRHSLGKAAIMIAESGTNLPSDIIMERVIFYHNDAQGVLDLKEALVKAESEIDFPGLLGTGYFPGQRGRYFGGRGGFRRGFHCGVSQNLWQEIPEDLRLRGLTRQL